MIAVIQVDDLYEIRFPYDEDLISIVKEVPGRRWVPDKKCWTVPSARVGFFISKLKGTKYEPDLSIQSNEQLGENATLDATNNIPDFDVSDYHFMIQDGLTPFKHQIDSIKYAAWRYEHGLKSGYLLADEPGLAKTLTTVNTALYFKQHYGIKRCLIIVCVNSAKYNWQDDIDKHSNGSMEGYTVGTRLKRNGQPRLDASGKDKYEDLVSLKKYKSDEPLPFFIILNIEAIRFKVGKNYPILDRLIDLINSGEIGMVALDEIHLNASMTSQQGKNLLRLKQKTQGASCYWIPMTGTPITSKPTDVFLPLRLVDGHSFNSAYMWNQTFCVYGGFGGHEVIGYKNIPRMKEMLQPNMLRRRKKDVLDLPPKIKYTRFVENSPYQQKLYAKVQSEIAQARAKQLLTKAAAQNEFLRLRQVNGSPEIIDKELVIDKTYLSKNARLAELMRILDEVVANGEKAIVFSNWVEPLRTLHRFIRSKYKVCCYTGTMSQEDRQLHKKTFIENPEYKVLIGTVGAMGVSHTLTVATNVIFYDVPWNPATVEQCEDRCYRPGTTETVKIYTLVAKDTIDEVVHNILSRKEGMSNYIVDDELDIVRHPELLDMLL